MTSAERQREYRRRTKSRRDEQLKILLVALRTIEQGYSTLPSARVIAANALTVYYDIQREYGMDRLRGVKT
jgi:hypothetical protein